MKAPFPWFGGKSKAAPLIWDYFGDVENYVEPFAGSLAVLLKRPHWPFTETRVETVNDRDCYVSNFWRAIQADPEGVAHHADWPVNEADLHARHAWLHRQVETAERLKSDPDFYDVRIAGYWCWGLSSWIGDNWCRPNPNKSVPHLGDPGKGVNRQLPHLGDPGKGVNRQLPHLGDPGNGECQERLERLVWYFSALANRLRGVRVCCGDWTRVLTPSVTFRHGMTGILLDPPYDVEGTGYLDDERGLSSLVREWAIANGTNPDLRIALCGYADEGHDALTDHGWTCVAWHANGGYANLSGKDNRTRERIWFSPTCQTAQTVLPL